jgi:hypothetical protein
MVYIKDAILPIHATKSPELSVTLCPYVTLSETIGLQMQQRFFELNRAF